MAAPTARLRKSVAIRVFRPSVSPTVSRSITRALPRLLCKRKNRRSHRIVLESPSRFATNCCTHYVSPTYVHCCLRCNMTPVTYPTGCIACILSIFFYYLFYILYKAVYLCQDNDLHPWQRFASVGFALWCYFTPSTRNRETQHIVIVENKHEVCFEKDLDSPRLNRTFFGSLASHW